MRIRNALFLLAIATAIIFGFWYYIMRPIDAGIKATAAVTPECLGQKNGRIQVTVTQPTGAITCTWSSPVPGITGTTGLVLNDLHAGDYTATLSVPGGTSPDKVMAITVGGQQEADLVVGQPNKVFDNSGSLTVQVKPAGTYTYAWADAPGLNQDSRTGLGPGVYSLTIDAGLGCTRTFTTKLIPTYGDATYCLSWTNKQQNVLALADWIDTGGGSLPLQLGYVNGQLSVGKVVAVGDCARMLRFTQANALLGYLAAHRTGTVVVKPFGHTGTSTNPMSSAFGRNDLAAQLLVLDMNMKMPNAGSLPIANPPLADVLYVGTPYHLQSVRDIYTAANRALGCGEDLQGQMLGQGQLDELYRVLVEINRNGEYLICADR